MADGVRTVVGVCCKYVHRAVSVDPLTGGVAADHHSAGMSLADEAALEWALRTASAVGALVRAVTVGPAEADLVLRQAHAAGAAQVVRVEEGTGGQLGSDTVARLLAEQLGDAEGVFCGDASLDRGTGAVPAFLAGELRASQALGCVGLEVGTADDASGELTLQAERRLDRGRREVLRLRPPFVVSVEATTARLRRASVAALLDGRAAPVRLVAADAGRAGPTPGSPVLARSRPYRPRARVVASPSSSLPALGRVLELTGMTNESSPARTVRAEPDEAAGVLLDALREWGELG